MEFIYIYIFLVITFVSGWSFCSWIDGYENASVRMSFGEFRQLYELAPNKWSKHSDYTYHRSYWVHTYQKGNGYIGAHISTRIAMKTIFDFWRLLIWQRVIDRKNKKKERLENERVSLKNLTIMIEKDAESIRIKLEKAEQEAEKLRQEIIDRLVGNE